MRKKFSYVKILSYVLRNRDKVVHLKRLNLQAILLGNVYVRGTILARIQASSNPVEELLPFKTFINRSNIIVRDDLVPNLA